MAQTTTSTITLKERRFGSALIAGVLTFGPLLRIGMPGVWNRLSNIALHSAAALGNENAVLRLLKLGVSPDSTENLCLFTPLHYAAMEGQIRTVKILLAAGADMNAVDMAGVTPLMLAAEFGHNDLVNYFMEAGAEIDARETAFGHTALFHAAQGGHLETVRLLLTHGAAPAHATRTGLTASQWVRKIGALTQSKRDAQLACATYLENWEKGQEG